MSSELKESKRDVIRSGVNDLRGVEHRRVHCDDAVVITGAEYLARRRRLAQLEAERDAVVPAAVTDEMIERAAGVLNSYRDSMELDEELAESVLRAALEVTDEQ